MRHSLREPSPQDDLPISISLPEPVHVQAREDDSDDTQLEATELRDAASARPPPSVVAAAPSLPGRIVSFWRNEIRASVPHTDCRDHLANERTFLSYLRTSATFSMLGVVVAQLYLLQHSPRPSVVFGYYLLGKPLCAILQSAALGTVVLGATRFWRQQSTMRRGKVRASGWELLAITGGSMLIIGAIFVLLVAVSIYQIQH